MTKVTPQVPALAGMTPMGFTPIAPQETPAMNYRREIDTLREIISQFAACEVEPCQCCPICREGVSKGGYTLSEAQTELHDLSARDAR